MFEDRLVRLIAGGHIIHGDDRRGRFLDRAGQAERRDIVLDHRGDGLHPLQHFQARLRLFGFRRFGAEAGDERLHMGALGRLLHLRLALQLQRLGALALELVIAAAVESQLLVFEVHDGIDRFVQKVAVMRDHQDCMRIFRHIGFEPQRAFQIEIVGRLVEQQQVRLREQNRRQRHPHPPAAGEGRGRPLLRRRVKAEAGQNGACPRLRRMRVNVGEADMDFRNPVRVRRVIGFFEQRHPLRVRLQHDLQQRLLGGGRLLRHLADFHVAGQGG